MRSLLQKKNLAIYSILFLGLFLRLININQSLWLDEAINVVFAQKSNFLDYLSKYLIGDFHPPAHFAILWIWTHIFGYSEAAVRIPSVFFGVATIYLTYLIARQYSETVGRVSSMLLALAPLHIYYSQEARPYSLAAFAATLCSLFFLKFLKSNSFRIRIGFTLAATLVLYSDYVSYFIFPAQFVFLLVHHKKRISAYLGASVVSLIFFIPWLFIFPLQLKNGVEMSNQVTGWKDVVGGTNLKEVALLWAKTVFGRITFENKLVYGAILGVASALYLYIFTKTKKEIKKLGYPFLWLIIPPALAFLFSYMIPVFSYFRFIFILPAFYILISLGIEKMNEKIKWTIIVLILIIQTGFSFTYLLNPQFHREDWKSAVRLMEGVSSSDSAVLFKNSEIVAPFSYYSKDKYLSIPAQKTIPAKEKEDIVDLKSALADKRKVYLFDYLKDITDPQDLVSSKLKEEGYKNTATYDFRGVGFVYLYEKNH
jgi:mannosyltransferase